MVFLHVLHPKRIWRNYFHWCGLRNGEQLTKKEWISSMVITNIHLRKRSIEFLYRNQYDYSLLLLGVEWNGSVIGEGLVFIMRLLYARRCIRRWHLFSYCMLKCTVDTVFLFSIWEKQCLRGITYEKSTSLGFICFGTYRLRIDRLTEKFYSWRAARDEGLYTKVREGGEINETISIGRQMGF